MGPLWVLLEPLGRLLRPCWENIKKYFFFGPQFASQNGTKNPPRCVAAPGVLDPTGIYSLLTYCFSLLGGAKSIPPCRSKFFHVGAMLALLSLLGASWAHFSRLAALVGAFGRFSCVLECSGHDFGASWAPFSWLLKRPWPHFSRFFCTTCVMAQLR